MAEPLPELTVFLERWRQGDDHAASELLSAVYNDLHRVAAGYMRRERANHTLQPTALLHEAWLRLSQADAPILANREQFFRAMAAYMRRQLVDNAVTSQVLGRIDRLILIGGVPLRSRRKASPAYDSL
jgi:RNA polymerase sigma factor (TIGR02999 family)